MNKAHTAALALFLMLLTSGISNNAISAEKLVPGDRPPEALGQTSDGTKIEVTQYAGKVLVVTFWASWCGPCKKELPILEAIQQVGGKDKIQVVAINIEERQQFAKLARALTSLALTLTHDSRKQSAEAFGVHGIPHLVIIGRDGKVINVHRGYSEEGIDAVVAEINAALTACHDAGAMGKECSKASS